MKSPLLAPRLGDYVRLLRDSWIVICAAAVLSAAAGWAVYATRPAVYTATTSLFAVVPGGAGVRSVYSGARDALGRVETYARLSTSSQVLMRTAADLTRSSGTTVTARELASHLAPVAEPGSVLLKLYATTSNADEALDMANAWARNTVDVAREADSTGLSTAGPTGLLLLVDGAVSASGTRGGLGSYLALAAGLGLVSSCLLVLIRGLRRSAVLTTEQLDRTMRELVGGRP